MHQINMNCWSRNLQHIHKFSRKCGDERNNYINKQRATKDMRTRYTSSNDLCERVRLSDRKNADVFASYSFRKMAIKTGGWISIATMHRKHWQRWENEIEVLNCENWMGQRSKKKRAHLKTTQTIESKWLVHRFRGYVLESLSYFCCCCCCCARLSQGQ